MNKIEKIELKPCPFCGGEATISVITDAKKYRVKCNSCPVTFGRWWFDKEKDAAEAWNRRADAVEVVWKPVLGFEGLYEISTLGKVRNKKGEILKQGLKRTNCTCYKIVNLWKDGRYYKKYVHRLIAEAFIPNTSNLPMVNHKDEDGTNNSIDNLEWCTREYNVNYGTAKERRAKKIRGVKHTEEHKRKIAESMKRHFAKKHCPNCGARMMDGEENG